MITNNKDTKEQIRMFNDSNEQIAESFRSIGLALKQVAHSINDTAEVIEEKSKYRAYKHNKNKIKNVGNR